MWIMCASYYENIILLMALNILYNQAKFIFKYFYVTLYLAAFYWSSLPLIYISVRLYFVFSSFLTSCHWSTRNALKLLENITSEIVTLISCIVLTNLCSHQYTEKWKAHLGIWSSEHGSLFLTVLLIICVCPGVGAQGWSWDRSLCARSSTAFSPATY